MSEANPRVLLVSHRFVKPHVSWASAFEFEDVVCEIDDVDLVAPSRVEPRQLPGETTFFAQLQKHLGLEVHRRPGIEKTVLRDDYDLLFVRVMTPADLHILDSIEGWRDRCRVKVCWVEELWAEKLRHAKMLRLFDPFDHVFVAHAGITKALSERIKPPCSYLSFGVDALRFCPHPNPPPRSIDFYALGRRSSTVHQELFDRANRAPGFNYFYDSARWTNFVEDHTQHRQLTANLIKRTRYFMADRAKANAPDQTGGNQVFGPRYFEGAAAGAILVGDPPDCDVFRSYFNWPDAVIPFSFGSHGIVDLLDSLDAEPGRLEVARRANIVNVLRRHDWSQRWNEVLEVLGLEPGHSVAGRVAALGARAREVEATGQKPLSAPPRSL